MLTKKPEATRLPACALGALHFYLRVSFLDADLPFLE